MPISMSVVNVNDDVRQELLSKNVENNIGNGVNLGADIVVNNPDGEAGISDTFVGNFINACTTYIAGVDAIINKIEDIDSSSAFKGTALQPALSKFVESIKKVAKDFTWRLDKAEKQIIKSVGTAYQTQDSDIASDLKSNSENLVGNNMFVATPYLGPNLQSKSSYSEINVPATGSTSIPSDSFKSVSDEELARRVCNGEFGNGDAIKQTLGSRYNAVQSLVDQGFGKNSSNDNSLSNNKKSADEIAVDVIRGNWGNGQDRKNRLIDAGYNYNEVQSRVNQLLSNSTSSNNKSVDEIAVDVIRGNWGNGQDRKNRLTKAGYNYNEVQSRVNQLLK